MKTLLAFSGGLDTSFCVVWLHEQKREVHTITVNTGGFSSDELSRIEKLAHDLGAASHVTVDAREELFRDYLRYLLAGNVLRGGVYPLSVSAERVCQAKTVVRHGLQLGVGALAHGSTSAGNDQVRFDVAFRTLAPQLEIVTPIRDLELSRADEQKFLARHGFGFPEKTQQYSINEGMWGTSIGGKETHDSWQHLPESAYPGGEIEPTTAPRSLTIGFDKGIPSSLDGNAAQPVAIIEELNRIGRPYGIGRGIHLGDTILGIKGRVAFEAPAAQFLITAHRELEKLVLSGKQMFWKEHLGNLYGTLLHEGQFFDPLGRDLERFLESSQARVTGEVRLKVYPRGFAVEGVKSPHTLMRAEASYGEATSLWNGSEAAAFAKVFGVPQMLAMNARLERDALSSRESKGEKLAITEDRAPRFERFTHARRTPAHPVPIKAGNRPVIIFLTVCAANRKRILAKKDAVEVIIDAWKEANQWLVGRYIILPDHIHLFCAPARPEPLPVQKWAAFWKSRASTHWPRPDEQRIWQVDCWDTQLRRGENYDAKWEYVRNNAVRQGLVNRAEDWPWQGELNILQWHDV